jgi:hypothetical protein
MMHPLFAQEGGGPLSWFMSFADRWGNTASVIGLAITLIGFGLTLLGLFLVGRKVRQAMERVGVQILVMETATLLRLVTEARDAARDGIWWRGIDRCQQARLLVVPLRHNPHLLPEEQEGLRKADNDLRLVLQYIENERLPPGSPVGNLPDPKKKAMDAMITLLGDIQGRLQKKALEV